MATARHAQKCSCLSGVEGISFHPLPTVLEATPWPWRDSEYLGRALHISGMARRAWGNSRTPEAIRLPVQACNCCTDVLVWFNTIGQFWHGIPLALYTCSLVMNPSILDHLQMKGYAIIWLIFLWWVTGCCYVGLRASAWGLVSDIKNPSRFPTLSVKITSPNMTCYLSHQYFLTSSVRFFTQSGTYSWILNLYLRTRRDLWWNAPMGSYANFSLAYLHIQPITWNGIQSLYTPVNNPILTCFSPEFY